MWASLEALAPVRAHTLAELDPCLRHVGVRLKGPLERALKARGESLRVRALAPEEPTETEAAPARRALDDLPPKLLAVLTRALRLAEEGVFLGTRAWDPHGEARAVDTLVNVGLITALDDERLPRWGRYRLAPGLPEPAPVAYAFEDAVMPPPPDLAQRGPSLLALEQDVAVFLAGVAAAGLRRTVDGHPDVAGARRLGRRLMDPNLSRDGRLTHASPRWQLAARVVEALGLWECDPLSRALLPAQRVQRLLSQGPSARFDGLARRVVEQDARPLIPALRAALRAAGDEAIDEVVLRALLAEQHRDLLFAPWGQVGARFYPCPPEATPILYDDDGFDEVEGPLLSRAIDALARLGLVTRAPGVFAATAEGRVWAGLDPTGPTPRLLLSADLELVVPPGALPPWERLLIELATSPVSRDVVDRLRLGRAELERALGFVPLTTLLAVLESRVGHRLPPSVVEALQLWARPWERIVWEELRAPFD
ncbi:MAG: hypothetical protein RIT28_1586 [Pseudomonadota bacterium]